MIEITEGTDGLVAITGNGVKSYNISNLFVVSEQQELLQWFKTKRPDLWNTVALVNMQDITAPKAVEILIQDKGKIIWVNTENGCVLRICQIPHLSIIDERMKRKVKSG